MSLLERVTQVRQRIHDLKALEARAARASEFEQRANTLVGIADALEPLCVPAAVLEQADIEVPQLDQPLLAALRTRAVELKAGYAQDRSSILAPFPGQDFRNIFLNPCNSFRQKTEAAFRDAWSGWVRRQMPAIDQEVLNVLSGVNALNKAVTDIQDLLGLIDRCAAVLPQSADDVKQVLVRCAQVNQAWHDLAGDGIAPDVLAFLRAAGSRFGASYDMLTPSILAWLDAHDLRRVLRIRLG